ncbi:bola-like protein-domain-containing protein [Dichotomocladium elegans]|nr:bola-like protein-domain-containing protein [Dichotomocladium elegans]
MEAKGPIQESVERKIIAALDPSSLEIVNESHLHAHHAAMRGNTNPETHFRITIVSESFTGKPMMQRHRLVYNLLNDELQNGIHALSLKTKTKEEMKKAVSA